MKRTKSFQLGHLVSKREDGLKNLKHVNKRHGQQMLALCKCSLGKTATFGINSGSNKMILYIARYYWNL